MHTRHPRTAKSARRGFSLTLLGVLVALAAASIAVYAAVTEAPGYFTLKATPSTQTVTPGQVASYAVALERQNQFVDPVSLSVSNLPANTKVNYHPGPIPGSSSASTVTIETNVGGTTPSGTRQLTIKGTSGTVTSSATVSLTVLAPNTANFTITGRQAIHYVTENDSAAYSIAIARAGGFSGPVALSATNVPRGTTVSFSYPPSTPDSATMNVVTDNSAQPGRYAIVVVGAGQSGPNTLTRYTSVGLDVEEKKPFNLSHAPVSGLSPGNQKRLNLALSNPHNFDILIQEVAVSLEPYTSSANCGAKANFAVEPMALPTALVLPAESTRTLSQLGVPESSRPAVKMLNLATNQDACKGVEVGLQFSGWASKK